MRPIKGDTPSTSEDRTKPTRSPSVVVRADTEALGTSAAVASAKDTPAGDPSQEFDPWKFGSHTVPPGLREEILKNGFPDTPEDQLFNRRLEAAKAGVAAKAGNNANSAEPLNERSADTLRIRIQPPLVHPLRAAAMWLVLAAVGMFLLLWLLLGREKPAAAISDPQSPAVVAPPARPPAAATPVEPKATSIPLPSPITGARTQPSVAPAPEVVPPPKSKPVSPTSIQARPGSAVSPARTTQAASGLPPTPPASATAGRKRIVPADD